MMIYQPMYINMHSPWTHIHTFQYVIISVYIKQFILITPTLMHCLIYHSNHPRLFNWKISLQKWDIWLRASTLLLLNCSIPVYMYNDFRIINPYTHKKQFYQLEYSADVHFFFFPFSPIDYSFPEFPHLAFFTLPSFSEDVSYVCCTVIFFCHISLYILESLNFLSDFLKFAYFRIYFFAVSFYIFWQMCSIMCPLLQYHTG